MRFMFIVKSDHTMAPTPKLLEALHKLADREIKAGRMLDSGGLMPLAKGAQVRITDGQLSKEGAALNEAAWMTAAIAAVTKYKGPEKDKGKKTKARWNQYVSGMLDGAKERVQVFEGDVIARQNAGVAETVTVRRLVQGEGVERIFPIHSPRIAKIVVKKAGLVRRAKLYYLRDRVGKATKIRDDVKRQTKIDVDLKTAAEAAAKAAQEAAAKATAEGGMSKSAQKKKAKKDAAEAAKKK